MNNEELEEKLAELRQKYRDLLGEGRTEDATEVYREAERLKGNLDEEADSSDEEEVVEEDGADEDSEEESGVESFEDLKGVGDELASVLEDRYGSVKEMAEASIDDLEPVPGIGETRAESLMEQLN